MLVPAPGAPGSPRAGPEYEEAGRWFPGGCRCPHIPAGITLMCSRCSAPHRALQHTNLLQCLAQCAEVTPYLLVMEFCPLVSPMCPPCPIPLPRMLLWDMMYQGVLQGCRQGAWHRCALLSPQWDGDSDGDSGSALQGDLKGYLRSCRGAEAMTPDLLTLQRMACEVACGVLHLHRNNYIHR